jgi:hypothetical protein
VLKLVIRFICIPLRLFQALSDGHIGEGVIVTTGDPLHAVLLFLQIFTLRKLLGQVMVGGNLRVSRLDGHQVRSRYPGNCPR